MFCSPDSSQARVGTFQRYREEKEKEKRCMSAGGSRDYSTSNVTRNPKLRYMRTTNCTIASH